MANVRARAAVALVVALVMLGAPSRAPADELGRIHRIATAELQRWDGIRLVDGTWQSVRVTWHVTVRRRLADTSPAAAVDQLRVRRSRCVEMLRPARRGSFLVWIGERTMYLRSVGERCAQVTREGVLSEHAFEFDEDLRWARLDADLAGRRYSLRWLPVGEVRSERATATQDDPGTGALAVTLARRAQERDAIVGAEIDGVAVYSTCYTLFSRFGCQLRSVEEVAARA